MRCGEYRCPRTTGTINIENIIKARRVYVHSMHINKIILAILYIVGRKVKILISFHFFFDVIDWHFPRKTNYHSIYNIMTWKINSTWGWIMSIYLFDSPQAILLSLKTFISGKQLLKPSYFRSQPAFEMS